MSLERALSKLGIASRTVANGWIREGRVTVNGVVRRDPFFPVNPEGAQISVDGLTQKATVFRALILHKPRGVVTTRSDEKGRATVFSVLPSEWQSIHLGAVGRLDLATTGLLILTNDTRFSAWLTDPANLIPRVYLVTVRGEVTEPDLEKLRSGILDEGEWLRPTQVELLKASGRESHLQVTLTGGKNREIRRLFLAIGNEVTRLKRISYGPLVLGDLAEGKVRELSLEEIQKAFPGADLNAALLPRTDSA